MWGCFILSAYWDQAINQETADLYTGPGLQLDISHNGGEVYQYFVKDGDIKLLVDNLLNQADQAIFAGNTKKGRAQIRTWVSELAQDKKNNGFLGGIIKGQINSKIGKNVNETLENLGYTNVGGLVSNLVKDPSNQASITGFTNFVADVIDGMSDESVPAYSTYAYLEDHNTTMVKELEDLTKNIKAGLKVADKNQVDIAVELPQTKEITNLSLVSNKVKLDLIPQENGHTYRFVLEEDIQDGDIIQAEFTVNNEISVIDTLANQITLRSKPVKINYLDEVIPFKVEYIDDDTLELAKEEIQTPGLNGKKTYIQETIASGKGPRLVRTLLEEVPAVNQVTRRGIKAVEVFSDIAVIENEEPVKEEAKTTPGKKMKLLPHHKT